jgi:hypothetical protein
MSVYAIYLGENDVYYGSTGQKISDRETRHNARLRSGESDAPLYRKARELGLTELNLVMLYEGNDYKEVENELIINNECLNKNAVFSNRERSLKLHADCQKRYYYRKKAEKLSNTNL